MFGLTNSEEKILRKLSTPAKIQDYLDKLPINFEKKGETYMSPRRVLREQKAHCFEGALLAATALLLNNEPPLLLDLRAKQKDADHVVALYKRNGYWGAISKSNHAVLTFRDPIYKTVRELALSYFNEYFYADTGEKTLISYSVPVNIRRKGTSWITAENDLDELETFIDAALHIPIVPKENKRYLRPVNTFELRTLDPGEWKKGDPRT